MKLFVSSFFKKLFTVHWKICSNIIIFIFIMGTIHLLNLFSFFFLETCFFLQHKIRTLWNGWNTEVDQRDKCYKWFWVCTAWDETVCNVILSWNFKSRMRVYLMTMLFFCVEKMLFLSLLILSLGVCITVLWSQGYLNKSSSNCILGKSCFLFYSEKMFIEDKKALDFC